MRACVCVCARARARVCVCVYVTLSVERLLGSHGTRKYMHTTCGNKLQGNLIAHLGIAGMYDSELKNTKHCWHPIRSVKLGHLNKYH